MSDNFYNQYRPTNYNALPPIIKNLIIINGLFFLATITLERSGIDLYQIFGLHFPLATDFRIWQPITYMFMHGDIWHITLNMFALWMFGAALENYWGPKRFLVYYFVTGLGAAVVHYAVLYFTSLQGELAALNAIMENPGTLLSAPEDIKQYIASYANSVGRINELSDAVNSLELLPGNNEAIYHIRSIVSESREFYLNKGTLVVGASGAVFGILLAFGMLFPNSEIYLYFMFPIKAKYFVIGYGLIELVNGLRNNPDDNVAHFAHLGGMLFGFILIKYWNKKLRNRLY